MSIIEQFLGDLTLAQDAAAAQLTGDVHRANLARVLSDHVDNLLDLCEPLSRDQRTTPALSRSRDQLSGHWTRFVTALATITERRCTTPLGERAADFTHTDRRTLRPLIEALLVQQRFVPGAPVPPTLLAEAVVAMRDTLEAIWSARDSAVEAQNTAFVELVHWAALWVAYNVFTYTSEDRSRLREVGSGVLHDLARAAQQKYEEGACGEYKELRALELVSRRILHQPTSTLPCPLCTSQERGEFDARPIMQLTIDPRYTETRELMVELAAPWRQRLAASSRAPPAGCVFHDEEMLTSLLPPPESDAEAAPPDPARPGPTALTQRVADALPYIHLDMSLSGPEEPFKQPPQPDAEGIIHEPYVGRLATGLAPLMELPDDKSTELMHAAAVLSTLPCDIQKSVQPVDEQASKPNAQPIGEPVAAGTANVGPVAEPASAPEAGATAATPTEPTAEPAVNGAPEYAPAPAATQPAPADPAAEPATASNAEPTADAAPEAAPAPATEPASEETNEPNNEEADQNMYENYDNTGYDAGEGDEEYIDAEPAEPEVLNNDQEDEQDQNSQNTSQPADNKPETAPAPAPAPETTEAAAAPAPAAEAQPESEQTAVPAAAPTAAPQTEAPTPAPSQPTTQPTNQPATQPTAQTSSQPSSQPAAQPVTAQAPAQPAPAQPAQVPPNPAVEAVRAAEPSKLAKASSPVVETPRRVRPMLTAPDAANTTFVFIQSGHQISPQEVDNKFQLFWMVPATGINMLLSSLSSLSSVSPAMRLVVSITMAYSTRFFTAILPRNPATRAVCLSLLGITRIAVPTQLAGRLSSHDIAVLMGTQTAGLVEKTRHVYIKANEQVPAGTCYAATGAFMGTVGLILSAMGTQALISRLSRVAGNRPYITFESTVIVGLAGIMPPLLLICLSPFLVDRVMRISGWRNTMSVHKAVSWRQRFYDLLHARSSVVKSLQARAIEQRTMHYPATFRTITVYTRFDPTVAQYSRWVPASNVRVMAQVVWVGGLIGLALAAVVSAAKITAKYTIKTALMFNPYLIYVVVMGITLPIIPALCDVMATLCGFTVSDWVPEGNGVPEALKKTENDILMDLPYIDEPLSTPPEEAAAPVRHARPLWMQRLFAVRQRYEPVPEEPNARQHLLSPQPAA